MKVLKSKPSLLELAKKTPTRNDEINRSTTDDMAELVVAYFTGEVNARQVAEVLGVSATNVKSHLGTALFHAVRAGKISIALTR